jgi:drug/metabolite transporter (DMT)-like permease
MNAAGWAVTASVATAATHAAMRSVDLHPFLVAFWRNAFCLVLILPLVLPARSWRRLPGAAPRHALRGVANTAAMVLLIMGLARIPFAEATALTFATPAFVVIGGVLFLGERPGAAHWLAAGLGFAGVLVIAPPGPGWLGSGGALVLASSAFFAASMLIGRTQTRYADNLSILFHLYVALTLFSAPLAATVWVTPDRAALAGLGLVAVFAVAAHYAAVVAIRRAEASRIAPIDYLRLIWGAAIGLAVFAEAPSGAMLAGAALILAAALAPLARRAPA